MLNNFYFVNNLKIYLLLYGFSDFLIFFFFKEIRLQVGMIKEAH